MLVHTPDHPSILPLVSDDLPELLKLSREEAWTHTERDWKVMLATGQTYGHIDYRHSLNTTSSSSGSSSSTSSSSRTSSNRKLLSCIQVTDYGPSLAMLGMLIVSKRHRMRGLATSLVNHVLTKNQNNRPMGLVAASQAKSFYPPFGVAATGEHVLTLTRAGGMDETSSVLEKFH